MNFEIKYHSLVIKSDLPKISSANKKRIKVAIESKLMVSPEKYGKPLRRSLKGNRSLRVGAYRVVFRITGDKVLVFAIEHRSRVYLKIESRM